MINKFRAFIDGVMISADDLAFEHYKPLKDQLAECENITQCTGLKDRNGNETYIDDVVIAKLTSHTGKYLGEFEGIVRFGEFEIQLEMEDGSFPAASWVLVDEFRVIGNIYEHPHLVPWEWLK